MSFDLGGAGDSFWVENSCSPFPKVAEAVEARLKEYQAEMAEVQSRSTGGAEDVDAVM